MPKRSIGIRRATGLAALTLSIAVPLGGCGGASPAAPATVTVTAPQPTEASISSTDPPVAAGSTDSTPPDDGQTSPTGPTLDPGATGKPLTLADFFEPDSNWTENRFNIADRKQVQGIGTDLSSCARDEAQELELRLENNFKTLQFEVGQANSSIASNETLIVEVVGNNSKIDIQRVPFNKIQNMTVSVDSVNALQILLYLDDQDNPSCGQSKVSVVLYDAVLG